MNWKYLLIISLLLLTGCLTGGPKLPFEGTPPIFSVPVYTWADRYVVEAKGDWQPWSATMDGISPVYPPGVFLVDSTGTVIEVQSEGELKQVPYDAKTDVCLTEEMKNVTCSPDWVVKHDIIPNDSLYTQLWGLKNIEIEKVWDTIKTSTIKIAVLDSGVTCSHPDIHCSEQFNAINGGSNANDDNGHGSHVAGTICATGNNGSGVAGTNWSCNLLAIKFLSANGSGSTYAAIKGIDYAVAHGAKIINNSWGGGGFSTPLYNSIKRACDAGLLFVAAAGNEGVNNDNNPHYPSSYDLPCVLAVASIDQNERLSSFSNYGKQSVDLAAPGRDILSIKNTGGYFKLSGTSMATPHVAGVAGLIFRINGIATKNAILQGTKTLPKLTGKVASNGTLSAYGALSGTLPTPCKKKSWKDCRQACGETYVCSFRNNRLCRQACRLEFNCPGKCGEQSN